MDYYGQRFISRSAFASWVNDNNAGSVAFWNIDEYVDAGLLRPAIETVAPPEVAREPYGYEEAPAEWEALHREDSEDDLAFDRLRGISPYLREYTANAAYPMEIIEAGPPLLQRPRVERYFAYWQVHQVRLISDDPALTRFRYAISRLPPEHRENFTNGSLSSETIQSLRGLASGFDFLSRWITRHGLIRRRAFRDANETDGLTRLTAEQAAAYRTRVQDMTHRTIAEYQLNFDSLWEFLRQLLELARDYRRQERVKLAKLVERDIRELSAIIWSAFDLDEQQIHQKLIRWYQWDFQAAWPQLGRLEQADRTFKHFGERFRSEAAAFEQEFSQDKIESLIRFAVDENLWEFLDGVGNLTWTADEQDNDWLPAFRYRRARAAAAALEFFVSGVIRQSRPDLAGRLGGETFGPVLTELARLAGVREVKVGRLRRPDDWLNEFANIASIEAQDWKSFVEQQFRFALLARNLTTHRALRDWNEGEHWRVSGVLAEAVVFAAFIAWVLLSDGLVRGIPAPGGEP